MLITRPVPTLMAQPSWVVASACSPGDESLGTGGCPSLAQATAHTVPQGCQSCATPGPGMEENGSCCCWGLQLLLPDGEWQVAGSGLCSSSVG